MYGSSDRVKMRIACEVSVGAQRHSGLVLNVSPSGLFVQTHAKPTAGDPIRVALNVPGAADAMALDATVVWKRVVPAGLVRVAQGGVGVCLLNPPEGYYQFLASALRARNSRPAPEPITARAGKPKDSPIPEAPAAAEDGDVAGRAEASLRTRPYRVRVSHGQRSRIVTVSATSEAHAREIALGRVGEGWKVIES